MDIAAQLLSSVAFQHSKGHNPIQLSDERYNCSSNSMSQDYHQQGIFSFSSNGFERSQQQILHHQIRRDKHTVQGFEPLSPHLVALEEDEPAGLTGNAGIFSEMLNFSSGATITTELLESQRQANYRASRRLLATGGGGDDWYGGRQPGIMTVGDFGPSSYHSKDPNFVDERDSVAAAAAVHHQQQHQVSSINGDSATAMQLFLMNPQPKSTSPTSHPPPPTSSTLHMLLPHPSTISTPQEFNTKVGNPSPATAGGTASAFGSPSSLFTWFPDGTHERNLNTAAQLNDPIEIGGHLVEGQGPSLSLASSLQHMDATKAEELRMGDGGILFFHQGGGPSTAQYQYRNLLQSDLVQNQQVHVGFGSSLGMANLLRNSKYLKAAQELLEEFCSVGKGQFKKGKFGKNNTNPNSNPSGSGGGGGGGSSSSSKDPPPSLPAAERLEHQRRKVKLLSMLDEVDRRYNRYCEQMQMVVNSFDLVMGFGAAIPYTTLAQKAMSRHFRCLKDAIASQLKQSCELLGEKDASTSGVTKGETPRLRMLEQSLRQQRAFHQMGMMEQEAWRPQRGLPERSVNILRAWLFEHFLNPYPSDADKHLLARQTGLSRNQVSNWFINARVRLWKPMIEEMYEQEIKQEATRDRERSQNSDSPQTSTPPTAAAAAANAKATAKRSEINASESDPSLIAINTQCFSENQAKNTSSSTTMVTTIMPTSTPTAAAPSQQQLPDIGSKLIRFGTIAGDVSLTLGLRHAGNLQPEKSSFSVRHFRSC